LAGFPSLSDLVFYFFQRLLDSYREFQNPASHRAIERTRGGPTTVPAQIPVSFPESYPFPLVAYLPNVAKTSPPLSPSEALFNPGLGETAIVFLVLVLSSPRKHILNFLESSLEIEGKDHFATLLTQFFKVATSILQNDAFPSSWLNVNILAHKVLIKMMDPVAILLERDFIPDQEHEQQFDVNLWREGFFMLLKLLSSDQLVIEEFSAQVRVSVVSFACIVLLRFTTRNAGRYGAWLEISVAREP
jgi:dedicator of cytokinesis protein 3